MTTPEQTAWLRANKATKSQSLKPSAAVRGAPGRASADWVGIVVANEPLSGDRPYWMVRWMEREQMPDRRPRPLPHDRAFAKSTNFNHGVNHGT